MTIATQPDIVAAVRAALSGSASEPAERAAFLDEIARAFYDYAKYDAPDEGGGLDGRDSPERAGLGLVVDATTDHLDNCRTAKFA